MIPSLARRVLGKVGQAQIKKLRPMRFPFSFSKMWRVPATVKPVLESNYRQLPAMAWLFVAFLCAALTVRGAEESVVRIDRSRASIAELRSDLIEWGCSRELSNQLLELTKQSDLRTDEIELVVHYAILCSEEPDAGSFLINSLIANHDFRQIKLRASRRLVRDATRYFGHESMVRVLDGIEATLGSSELARVTGLSDDDIRAEIKEFKETPNPNLRDQLSEYAQYLFRSRPRIYGEIVDAVLESEPENTGLLAAKGMSHARNGNYAAAKEFLAKAWQKKALDALLPYSSLILKTNDLPAASSLVDDLIRYQKWDEQIPKVLLAFAFILQKEPGRYLATVEKILTNVNAADLKDDEGRQLHEKLMQGWKERRERNQN